MLEASQMGRAMVQQVFATGMPWSEKSLNEYVNRLGQNLARSSGSQQIFAFYVVYNPQVNAQAFPGGYIVINSGVISLAESEAELASVLSHEIAHENSCDWRMAPRKAISLSWSAWFQLWFWEGRRGSPLSREGAGRRRWRAPAPAGQRRSGPTAWRLSTWFAPAMIRARRQQFFQRLQAEMERSGGESGGLLATHPRSVDRRKKVEKIIPNLPPPEFAPHDETEFLRMRQAVREYDEMYSRLVGVRVPGQDAPPPVLSRRPSSSTSR